MTASVPDKQTSELAVVSQLIEEGNTREVLERFGQAYALSGEVVEGNKIGRTLGYPTANLRPDKNHPPIPAQGVYTAQVSVGGKWYDAMVNIGIRPTLDLNNVTVEAHLFDFCRDIYGQRIFIHFLERIRDEMRFSSLSELKSQLDRDREVSLRFIEGLNDKLVRSGEALLLKA